MKHTKISEQNDAFGHLTGVEKEDCDQVIQEKNFLPFDPEDIDVTTRTMMIGLMLSRAENGMINLQPDFQRRWGIWDQRRQSRLIESLLLRIPLPVIYAAEDQNECWDIVDGIQRLSTITRFIQPHIINEDPLILSGLEYLKDCEGKTFCELNPRLQMRLREAELIVHLIRKDTPSSVKFNIFARINTGGISLSRQELRHAITPGKARYILEEWASSQPFLEATSASVQKTRMDDRELVLRFLAFYMFGFETYRQHNMDSFLIFTMKAINDMSDDDLKDIKLKFDKALQTSSAIFDRDSFRKRYNNNAKRLPINKALFESLTVNLARFSDQERLRLINSSGKIRSAFMHLCSDRRFENAISQGTGDTRKVYIRFSEIKKMFEENLSHA